MTPASLLLAARRIGRALLLLAFWPAAIGYPLLVLAHLLGPDSHTLWVGLHAFIAWGLAPAPLFALLGWLLARSATGRSRIRLQRATAGLLLVSLFWLSRGHARIRRRAAPTPGPRLRLVSANVLMKAQQPGPTVTALLAEDADIIVLQEYNDTWAAAFERQLEGDYPHRWALPREDPFGLALFSRLPVDRIEQIDIGEGIPAMRAQLHWQDRPIELWSVHPIAPSSSQRQAWWEASLHTLAAQIAAVERPVIVAGDFNMTVHNPSWRIIDRVVPAGRDESLLDGHLACGAGGLGSWPNGFIPLPNVRIDYVWLSQEWACARLHHGPGPGSDHRPVVIELGWRGAR